MKKNEKIICHCNGVSEKAVVKTIHQKGAIGMNDIQRLTLAATGCRRCFAQVEEILLSELDKLKVNGLQLKINFIEDK
ncbi:MAG TPA: (2Fe-2S)-binding protein [Tenuifilum sp.]|uniref:(2Fe-2S)-binding protein n=1 Tax=Tenuifilum sp. TaxID=2760880 RepID=UPI001B4EA8C6|nr:(2Fe-2S)-binding protein [Bacteroidales bacterium]HOK87067.1 (2Fe-2S)-binding protein [Tenuifilum sp.]MBP9028483.1 (2Fe-2S)-binding protein [Bacteroidales bacterium]HON71598.1 (2Fe-2S)-binding protein [Tenuifilum sp.]HOU75094.1 (2Fe-2S)-binding protein [Tenuifilum sp.]